MEAIRKAIKAAISWRRQIVGIRMSPSTMLEYIEAKRSRSLMTTRWDHWEPMIMSALAELPATIFAQRIIWDSSLEPGDFVMVTKP